MAAPSLLPRTAPFGDDERVSLDRVLGAATRDAARMARRLSCRPRFARTGAAPQTSAPPRAAEPLTILFASESGNSERLAQDVAKLARKSGFKPSIVDFADLDVAELAAHKRLVVIAATWGEGDPPARAVRAYGGPDGRKARRALTRSTFAVLALGDTAYVEFCAVGKAIDARLDELGAVRAVDRVDCDLDFEAPAATWIKATLETLAPALEAAEATWSRSISRAAAVPSRAAIRSRRK